LWKRRLSEPTALIPTPCPARIVTASFSVSSVRDCLSLCACVRSLKQTRLQHLHSPVHWTLLSVALKNHRRTRMREASPSCFHDNRFEWVATYPKRAKTRHSSHRRNPQEQPFQTRLLSPQQRLQGNRYAHKRHASEEEDQLLLCRSTAGLEQCSGDVYIGGLCAEAVVIAAEEGTAPGREAWAWERNLTESSRLSARRPRIRNGQR
jgi:hypothetical protein